MNNIKPCLFILTLLFLTVASVFGQTLSPTRSNDVKLFETSPTTIRINEYDYRRAGKTSPITFVVLHHNEDVGLKLVKDEVKDIGGRLIEIISNRDGHGERYIIFPYESSTLCFDPNRIFSVDGIKKTLVDENLKLPSYCKNNRENDAKASVRSKEVLDAVGKFQTELLAYIFPEKKCRANGVKKVQLCAGEVVVAVHNNTDFDKVGNSAINARWFLRSESEGPITEASYIVNKEDLDNFFIVSSNDLFSRLLNFTNKTKQFTVAVQKSKEDLNHLGAEADDGSFSIYCGKKGFPYINIEADIDRGKARQLEMIQRIIELFPSK